MEKERMQFNFAQGGTNEVIIREGAAPKVLDPKAPIKTDLKGTIGTVVEYLTKRIDKGQFKQEDCHILADRDSVSVELVINESDEYKCGHIAGRLQYNPKFLEFGINTGKAWSPTELGLFIKMSRPFFPDRRMNMELVSTLMNFQATVNNKIERSVTENGSRTDNFAQVVNSNLPKSFNIEMPIFKGMPSESIEVETFAQINGREVAFVLLSPGAQAILEELRDNIIDAQLEQIREIAPEIAIIEI